MKMSEFLQTKEIIEYPNGSRSYFYAMNQTVIIVDEGIGKCDSLYVPLRKAISISDMGR